MKLLFIDDELARSAWIRRRLEFENNQVLVSPNWQTGYQLMEQAYFDVVIMNVCLSDSDPVTTTGGWPARPSDMPLLLIVSPDTPDNKAWGLELGADDSVGESVDGRELLARLHALCRRRTGHFVTRSILSLADLELNLADKTVHRGGRRIDLLPREYGLLFFLLENQGRVVSKREIITNVWRTTVPVKSNTVEVYINYLRFKIDRQSPVKLIHTVTGMGYILRTT